jgi:hypothetical protein
MAMTLLDSVCGEIVAIYREDFSGLKSFGRSDERCIGKIHRMIRIPLHQIERSPKRLLIHEPDRDASTQDELSKALCSKAAWIEKMKGFGQNRNRRPKRFAQSS